MMNVTANWGRACGCTLIVEIVVIIARLVSRQRPSVILVMMAISGADRLVPQSLLVVNLTVEAPVHYASKDVIIMAMEFVKLPVIQILDIILYKSETYLIVSQNVQILASIAT